MKIFRYIGAFFTIPSTDKWLFLRSLILLYRYKILLGFMSFEAISTNLKDESNSVEDQEFARSVRKAIRRAGKLCFWKNLCLTQSFVAKHLLNKKNIASTGYLGVRKQEDEIFAHAWVESSGIMVVPRETDYTELHTF